MPNFYDHQELQERQKRNVEDDLADHKVHLVLPFNSIEHHLELTPNHEFISPDLVVETRGENAVNDLSNGIRFRRVPDMQCHYRGHVRGHENSRAALSLCEGVVSMSTLPKYYPNVFDIRTTQNTITGMQHLFVVDVGRICANGSRALFHRAIE